MPGKHDNCGFDCPECNVADDAAMRAEENAAATFAALVEVARAVNGFVHHSGGCRTYIGKKCDCGAAEIYDSLSRLRALNPKLLEDGR